MKFKIFLFTTIIMLSSCAGMLPNSKPIAKYDEFKKTWTVTSTRWGNDFTNIGPNPSLIRVFVSQNGNVSAQIYTTINTKEIMHAQHALDASGKRYKVTTVNSKVHCPTVSSCYWSQDLITSINYLEISELIDSKNHFKLRIYGRLPPKDISVLACQFWEVTKEINSIKKIDLSRKGLTLGASCSK